MGNRGCEALIRSTCALIRERAPDATFLCPSVNIALDRRQWPDYANDGVEFISALPYSARLKWWNRLRRVVPLIDRIDPPAYSMTGSLKAELDRVDAVLMTGGDIISLDYGVFSLHHWAGLVEASARAGKPVHLLAASVGPFTRLPRVEERMQRHLRRYTSITVRETPSFAYLARLGVGGVRQVADPAFTMVAQPWDDSAFIQPGADMLGFNVSPLVRETRPSDDSRHAFDEDIIRFLTSVIERTSINVLLVPHVYPLDGGTVNSDLDYMAGLLSKVPEEARKRIQLLPPGLNAVQLKYTIGRCRYFMGARTHATVASLSQSVPTCSIAYSVKALGINEDLLGDTRYVLPTPEVSFDSLWSHLDALITNEATIKSTLDDRMPAWKLKARCGVNLVA